MSISPLINFGTVIFAILGALIFGLVSYRRSHNRFEAIVLAVSYGILIGALLGLFVFSFVEELITK